MQHETTKNGEVKSPELNNLHAPDEAIILPTNPDNSNPPTANINSDVQLNQRMINSSSITVVQQQPQQQIGHGGDYQMLASTSQMGILPEENPAMGQQALTNEQITTQNDIYAIMDRMEDANTDVEREAMHAELQQALLQWDAKHQQPLQTTSAEKEILLVNDQLEMNAIQQAQQKHLNLGPGTGMDQTPSTSKQQIAQNDIYYAMLDSENAETDSEGEPEAEVQQALLPLDANAQQQQQHPAISEKERILKEKIAGFEDRAIITSLGLFFQIDRFARLFIRKEPLRAKDLILMAYQHPENDISMWIDQLQAADANFIRDLEAQRISYFSSIIDEPTLHKQKISEQIDSRDQNLLLYPFIVVGHLLNEFNPVDMSTESALIIREQMLHFGIIELLLKLLTRQAQQPIRLSAGSFLNHLLEDTSSSSSTIDKSPSVGTAANFIAASASSLPKGVGYSEDRDYWKPSGSNHQNQSNLMHEAENTVASLLKILIEYMNPHTKQEEVNRNRDIIAIYDDSDSGSNNSDSEVSKAQAQPQSTYGPPIKRPRVKIGKQQQPNDASPIVNLNQPHLLTMTEEFADLLYDFDILTTLSAYLINDSVFYISKMAPLFNAIVSFIMTLAESPPIKFSNMAKFMQFFDVETLAQPMDILAILLTTAEDRAALYYQLKKLGGNIKNYLNKLETWSKLENASGDEEELAKLLELLNGACSIICTKFRMDNVEEQIEANQQQQHHAEGEANRQQATSAADYCKMLKGLQSQTIPFFETTSENVARLCLPYHFASSLPQIGQATVGNAKRTRRLAQEIASLNNSLTLSSNGSIFVRTSEERLDVMKVMIVGPSGTPYANGCFEFDVFFPADYPNVPMQFNLETTGYKKVRFNPNLYADGKVCLSLLNTWSGRPEEKWNASTSTLLQVLVSIQSLILVEEPYYNEPGYATSRNTHHGNKASLEYTRKIRQECIRWAMIEHICNPPHAFAEVILRHFWLKRAEICEQIEAWIADTAGGSTQHYLATLNKHYETLKGLFAQLPCPEGLNP